MHSASAVRNGRAFLFPAVSGAGKTTISRLAPPDVTLLTDEISYVRRVADGYHAHGTPFAGDLGRAGENISAPVAGLQLLVQGRRYHAVLLTHRPKPPGGCCATFCFSPTMRPWWSNCSGRSANSFRGFRFTN